LLVVPTLQIVNIFANRSPP